ncbi:uncharacterized protein LOC129725196 [Wyeomyia smithii]|uniref:uncharacterized protein LOC129725196 n=1 Tax=Wyeomyia smithii TaxID=174621 RepID=UPI002467BC72|nr:uncharacterized protein LOC129725196 [Wyeomyia smithii]
MQTFIMLAKIFLLVLAVQVCRAHPDEVPGTLQVASPISLPVATAAFTCTGGYDSGCNNCTTQIQCTGSGTAIETTCRGSTPFCTSGSCSASVDPGVGCSVPTITCTGEGVFPDPYICQAYHNCSEANKKSDAHLCPLGFVFNAATLLCKQSSLAEDCVTVKCPISTGVGTYGTSQTYYAVCIYSNNSLYEILMLKCSDGATFDGRGCVYQCKEEGNFTDANDSTKYYQCYALNEGWAYYHLKCPSGKKFDATKQVCMPSTCTCTCS